MTIINQEWSRFNTKMVEAKMVEELPSRPPRTFDRFPKEIDGFAAIDELLMNTDTTVPENDNLPLVDHPTPDSPILVDPNVSACKRLINHAYLSHEVIPLIEAVFKSKDEINMLGHLRGDDAQTFVDVIHKVRLYPPLLRHGLITFTLLGSFPFEPSPSTDQALDLPDLPPQLRKMCLRTLCRVCGRQALLPISLQIPLCYNRLDTPKYRGGYADVWKGKHQGCNVAVKVLRIYSTSDFDKITRVGSYSLLESVR